MNNFLICVFLAVTYAITNITAKPVDQKDSETPLKVRGGIRQLIGADLEDAEEALKLSLHKLAVGDNLNLKLVKIHSASKQIVSGVKYKIKADFIDDDGDQMKTCDVTIWSQPWLENGIKVTFECEGQDKIVKNYSA